MRLEFSPTRSDRRLRLKRRGQTLVVNGKSYDFTDLAAGAQRDMTGQCDWFAGDVSRAADGTLTVPLILPHRAKASKKRLYPSPIDVETDGAIRLPR